MRTGSHLRSSEMHGGRPRSGALRTIMAGGVACLGLAAALPGQPIAAHAAGSSLAGVTVITGSSTGAVSVSLPQTVTLPADPDTIKSVLSIHGNGRIVGVVLHQAGKANGAVLAAFQNGGCWTAGCPAAGDLIVYPQGQKTVTLPAGDYVLDLIADGGPAPASVTLTLPGIAGSTHLTPTTALSSGAVSTLQSLPTPGMFSAGGATTLSGGGGLYLGIMTLSTDQPVANYGACSYKGAPPAGNAYLPGCAGGSVSAGPTQTYPMAGQGHATAIPVSVLVPLTGGGQWGEGFYAAVPAGATINAVAVWVDFTDVPSGGGASSLTSGAQAPSTAAVAPRDTVTTVARSHAQRLNFAF